MLRCNWPAEIASLERCHQLIASIDINILEEDPENVRSDVQDVDDVWCIFSVQVLSYEE